MESKVDKYEGIEYEVEQWMDDEEPGAYPKYIYTIRTEFTDYDSNDWYGSESDAHSAAKEEIDSMMDGPDEPDYDAPTFAETYRKAWEHDQNLKGRGW